MKKISNGEPPIDRYNRPKPPNAPPVPRKDRFGIIHERLGVPDMSQYRVVYMPDSKKYRVQYLVRGGIFFKKTEWRFYPDISYRDFCAYAAVGRDLPHGEFDSIEESEVIIEELQQRVRSIGGYREPIVLVKES